MLIENTFFQFPIYDPDDPLHNFQQFQDVNPYQDRTTHNDNRYTGSRTIAFEGSNFKIWQ